MSFYIGEFYTIHYNPMLKKYEYHKMVMFLIVKHEYKELRRKYLFDENNTVITERDYAESLKA